MCMWEDLVSGQLRLPCIFLLSWLEFLCEVGWASLKLKDVFHEVILSQTSFSTLYVVGCSWLFLYKPVSCSHR